MSGLDNRGMASNRRSSLRLTPSAIAVVHSAAKRSHRATRIAARIAGWVAVAAAFGAAGFAIAGIVAGSAGCTATEAQRAKDDAISVGITTADCAVAGAVTCTVDVLQGCPLPSVADDAAWPAALTCLADRTIACAESRGLACGIVAVLEVAQIGGALTVEGGQLPAAARAIDSKRRAEECVAGLPFRRACVSELSCELAVRQCLESALRP